MKSLLLLTCFHFVSMSSAISTTDIDHFVATLDRPQLLAFLGVEDKAIQIGDNDAIRPISASSVNPVVIYKADVPFLGKIHAGCCAGAIVRRFKNATVGVPCFSQELDDGSKFCCVCDEVWAEQDDRGFFKMDWESMPKAAEFYAPAKTGVLWKLPFMQGMKDYYSDEIQIVKDMFEGTELELHRDWPNAEFQEVARDLLIKSGVMHRDADKSKNPYRRDAWEHDELSEYLREMLSLWLRIRSIIDEDEMSTKLKALHRTAKSIGMAAMWRVQREHRRVPILIGTLVPADIMLAAFRSALECFKVVIHNISCERVEDALEPPEFDWGDNVEVCREWAANIKLLNRPARKAAPKYSTQKPVSTPKKKKTNNSSPTRSPSQVRAWYAAKNTTRPGAYVYKDVAESYNRDNAGSIKKCSSLAEVRQWLQMSAPRIYYEKELCKSTTHTTSAEFFAVKGGSEPGVYTTMAKAVQAKQHGGGTFAVFTSEADARAFAQQKQVFVVWAGREVGIMDKGRCIAATQRLEGAKMRGPMAEDAARDLWGSLQAGSEVISEEKNVSKSTKKKKKKHFYYAVALGRVPGVYDTWKEAEKQVKNVRPNLHSKFETKAEAQKFVDKHGSKSNGGTTPASHSADNASATGAAASSSPEADKDESQSQGVAQLEIETPSIEELEKAEYEKKVRVFACHTGVGKARIALSFEKAIQGVKDAAVQVVNSESTLLDNLAVAEVRLRASGKRESIADRLAAARARAGAKSHASTGSVAAASPSVTSTSGSYGSGMLVNRSAHGRAKETQLIQYYFIDHPAPIEVKHGSAVPFAHELDDDIDLPNTKAIFNTAGQVKDLTITDFFRAKEKAISSWPLMDFQEFMRICRKAQRMCQASTKSAAVVNAAALGELMDICLMVHRQYGLMNTLGPDEQRFKARMHLHLQHACQSRVLYASAIAMTVFEAATDPFVARLPNAKSDHSRVKKSPFAEPHRSDGTKPMSGCYLCTATDHFCNNREFHPLVNGKHKPVSDEMKEAIIKRIESSDLTSALKVSEKKRVRRYWSQHGL